jgi:hypothetical protein
MSFEQALVQQARLCARIWRTMSPELRHAIGIDAEASTPSTSSKAAGFVRARSPALRCACNLAVNRLALAEPPSRDSMHHSRQLL